MRRQNRLDQLRPGQAEVLEHLLGLTRFAEAIVDTEAQQALVDALGNDPRAIRADALRLGEAARTAGQKFIRRWLAEELA